MTLGIIIGILAGVFGLGVGVFFALYALGFFQYLGGKNSGGTAPVGRDVLFGRLLALNDRSKPYRLCQGLDTDLVAEWKFVDAKWYGILSKSGLKQSYRAMICLDTERHTARCFEQSGSVSWSAGMGGMGPSLHYSSSCFGGRFLFKKTRGVGYGFKDLKGSSPGKVYDYSFDINDIRDPIKEVVLKSGWEWVPVTAKRHASYAKGQTVPSLTQKITNFCMACGNRLSEGTSSCPKCREVGRIG
jgi:hypothetical protein